MTLPHAFYADANPLAECPHTRKAAACDVTVARGVDGARWSVVCLDCGREGPRAESPELAERALLDAAFAADLEAIADCVSALVLWRLAADGDPEAFALVQHALAEADDDARITPLRPFRQLGAEVQIGTIGGIPVTTERGDADLLALMADEPELLQDLPPVAISEAASCCPHHVEREP